MTPSPKPSDAAAASQGERELEEIVSYLHQHYITDLKNEGTYTLALDEAGTRNFFNSLRELMHRHCARREEALRRELAEAHRPWSVTLLVTTKEDPFGRYPCKVVDRGFADKIITVESEHLEELQARLTAAESEVAGLRAKLEKAK